MPTYRVYFIDPENRISRPPEVIECADDHEDARAKDIASGRLPLLPLPFADVFGAADRAAVDVAGATDAAAAAIW